MYELTQKVHSVLFNNMLTNQDLNAIKGIVREEVQTGFIPVRKDISNLQKDVSGLRINVTGLQANVTNLQTDMTVVKNSVKNLRKDLTKTIDFFDKASVATREKVNKTRKDLGLNEVEFVY